MGKRLRPDLPGQPFHLTARLQDREPDQQFTAPARDRVVQLLARALERTDASLLAFAVMTNHLHLVVVQGQLHLSRLMQPFLCSVALSQRSRHGLRGHVFDGRYRDRLCRDEKHLRSAIAYTHANPLRAGLCAELGEYRWSSHAAYATAKISRHLRAPNLAIDLPTGLALFAPGAPPIAARAAYLDFVRRTKTADAIESSTPPPPDRKPDLHTVAASTLGPLGLTVREIRSRWGPRGHRLDGRKAFLEAGLHWGFTGRELAGFLGIGESSVTRTLARS